MGPTDLAEHVTDRMSKSRSRSIVLVFSTTYASCSGLLLLIHAGLYTLGTGSVYYSPVQPSISLERIAKRISHVPEPVRPQGSARRRVVVPEVPVAAPKARPWCWHSV